MTLITCGNCGKRVAVTALLEHAYTCQREINAIATALAKDKIAGLRGASHDD
jgi:hypothetical protein